ncbi:bile acid:sodium symporter family protein [Tropicimonas aquimaris]|uniref:Bile acid:sodium symporter family protein n=1 Tax=Tropicimonas aquimaris TaxID=914152 RepID=A0ABW3IPT4_9RHOB
MPDAIVLFTGLVVFAQMFDMGLQHIPGSAMRLYRETRPLLRALLSSLVMVPLAAFLLIAMLPVSAEVAIGLVLLAAAPGAPLTTRRSEAAGADREFVTALQVTLAALAVLTMPLVIALFESAIELPPPEVAPATIARQVALVTFVPLALGWLFVRFAPEAVRRHAPRLSRASKLLFAAFIVAVVLALALVPELRNKLLIGWLGAAAVLALAAAALVSGHWLGGPKDSRRGGLAIVTVARNLGLALYIAERSEPTLAAIPTILSYGLLAMLLAMAYARWIRRRIDTG